MNVGRISYVNSLPFFHAWDENKFPLVSGTPRELSQLAARGKIDAAPLPIVECWKLQDEFEPLGPIGISVREKSQSVFLLSHKPFSEINDQMIGITTESFTSVALLKTLLHKKYQHDAEMKRGFADQDNAWLVIGDQALHYSVPNRFSRWSYCTDLAKEWWDWKKLPFVFAQWTVRKSVPSEKKIELLDLVTSSLQTFDGENFQPYERMERFLKVSPETIAQYLRGFTYFFGPDEISGMEEFRRLATEEGSDVLAEVK